MKASCVVLCTKESLYLVSALALLRDAGHEKLKLQTASPAAQSLVWVLQLSEELASLARGQTVDIGGVAAQEVAHTQGYFILIMSH